MQNPGGPPFRNIKEGSRNGRICSLTARATIIATGQLYPADEAEIF
jgi:hypothetical protein